MAFILSELDGCQWTGMVGTVSFMIFHDKGLTPVIAETIVVMYRHSTGYIRCEKAVPSTIKSRRSGAVGSTSVTC